MSFLLANLTVLISFLFIFSSRVEQNRIVTIQKPLVITQERKSPAYYLYQQTIEQKNLKKTQPLMTTYLSTQNLKAAQNTVDIAEMKVDHRFIASKEDSGFSYQEKAQPTLSSVYKVNEGTLPQPNQSTIKKWATIKGKFELKDGVGIVDHVIELKRIEEGQLREVGRVDLKEGIYSIDIEAPQGKLIAQIRDRSGILIGEDEQKLINLQSRGSYFEGPFIRVGHAGGGTIAANPPYVEPTKGSGLDGFSGGRGPVTRSAQNRVKPNVSVSLFSNQHPLDQPTDSFKNISKWSSTLASINDLNGINYPLVSIRQTNDPLQTPYFTKKWLEGVIDYISDQQKIEFKSKTAPVLIGQIYSNNKLSSGVQVQIENHPGVFPIYFDQFMIPNFKLNETSENGYFMFVGLEEDTYSVVAFKENKIISHQLFVAQEGVISFQNLVSSSTPSLQIVRTFDAFTSEPIETELIISDLEEIIPTANGTTTFKSNNKLGLTEIIAKTNASNYIPVRMIQDSRKDYTHIPMIQEAWLRQIQTEKLINDLPNTGAIIGFVPDFDYEVYLANENYTKDLIVYFDRFGENVPAPVRGGGFILFNVPDGAAEVIVQQKDADKIYSQVFNIRNNEVSISQFVE